MTVYVNKKIGLIVPSENTVVETDFHRYLDCSGITVHTSRLRWKSGKAVSSLDVLRSMNWDDLDLAAQQLADANVDYIVYGCTSGSFVGGKKWDSKIKKRITKTTSIDSITVSSAIISALNHLKIQKPAVVTPYPNQVNQALIRYLNEHRIGTTNLATFDEPDMVKHADITPGSINRKARTAIKKETDGILIACAQLRAIDIAQVLEEDLGLPVVTAVQASIWAALKKIDEKATLSKGGSLLTNEKISGVL